MTKLRDVPQYFDALDLVLSFVAGRADGEPHPSGSGVFIAPGLALTATHVLKDYSDRFEDIVPWGSEWRSQLWNSMLLPFSGKDFLLGLNAAQTPLSAVAVS